MVGSRLGVVVQSTKPDGVERWAERGCGSSGLIPDGA